jgi:hypothetical protein
MNYELFAIKKVFAFFLLTIIFFWLSSAPGYLYVCAGLFFLIINESKILRTWSVYWLDFIVEKFGAFQSFIVLILIYWLVVFPSSLMRKIFLSRKKKSIVKSGFYDMQKHEFDFYKMW